MAGTWLVGAKREHWGAQGRAHRVERSVAEAAERRRLHAADVRAWWLCVCFAVYAATCGKDLASVFSRISSPKSEPERRLLGH